MPRTHGISMGPSGLPRPSMKRNQGVVFAAVVFLLQVAVSAQWLNYPAPGIPRLPDGKPKLDAPAPRGADGHPDLSGVWREPTEELEVPILGRIQRSPHFINIGAGLEGGLPLQPWARDLMKARQADEMRSVPLAHCLPAGPVISRNGFNKIIQIPGLLVTLSEYNVMYRQIFTDARPLPVDPQPSWNGYSTGKWNGDTLFVETSGFRDGLWLDVSGTPMTDAAKLTERFRRPRFGTLEIEITVDDPKAYTRPWTVKMTETLQADTDLLEFVCMEHEKDLQHSQRTP